MDWLAHIDVDEFLWPETGVAEALTALPAQAFTARVRPAEALAPDTPDFYAPATAFKAMHIDRTARSSLLEARVYVGKQSCSGGYVSRLDVTLDKRD